TSPPRTFAALWPPRALTSWPNWYPNQSLNTSGSTSFIEIRMKQDSTVKEQSLNPQPAVRSKPQTETPQAETCETVLDERICAALHAASEKKAIEPVVLDLREIASFTDYF